MNISLPPELEKYVNDSVRDGRRKTPSAVVCDALLLLKEFESQRERDTDELRTSIAAAIEELDRGEGVPWEVEQIKAEGRKLLAASRVRKTTRRKGA